MSLTNELYTKAIAKAIQLKATAIYPSENNTMTVEFESEGLLGEWFEFVEKLPRSCALMVGGEVRKGEIIVWEGSKSCMFCFRDFRNKST